MKVVLQRVLNARVRIQDEVVAEIGPGLLVFVGFEKGDTENEILKTLDKAIQLRIFEDANGKMNFSVLDLKQELLLVSQFTLLADTSKGRRPHFIQAEEPQRARHLFELAISHCQNQLQTKAGVFGADMKVELSNNGPVTILLNSIEPQ
jgi:D-tyrosyl-tRNA(Tyr) deacylase